MSDQATQSVAATSAPSARIAVLTHASTDLAILHYALTQLPADFPPTIGINLQGVENETRMSELLQNELADADIIVLRILGRLGSVAGFAELLRHAQRQGRHLIALSGAGEPDAELAAVSTVPTDVLREALAYFHGGGSVNLAQFLRFVSDRLLLTGFAYESAVALPDHGIYHPDLEQDAGIADWLQLRLKSRIDVAGRRKPAVGIIFYRAHWMSGNTRFVDALVTSLEQRGMDVLPIFTASLRTSAADSDLPAALSYFAGEKGAHVDVLINTTSFAMGEITPGGPTPAGWSVSVLEKLNVPVLQAMTSGMTQDQWEISTRGMNPLDAAMNVVLPEFDGRIISVPLSFKAQAAGLSGSGDVVEFHPVADRVERIAGLAARFARLRALDNADKRIAFIFTNSNSKASQIGNAVGLDAPASLMRILESMREAGYAIGDLPESGSALIHTLVDRCSYDNTYLTSEQLQHAVGRVSADRYAEWFAELPQVLQQKIEAQWGAAPGVAYVHDNHLAFAGVELGNAFVALQPPRGYGMDPDAIYHQPDLPPTHHYYGLYRWLSDEWGADAIVHVGKHGTLEWLPGKGVGLSENCFPDALLGDMPLFYPFIINDPGEGSQAKRRGHAVVVDHLTPPMTTADSYGALAQLTQLVDEYYQVEVLDPSKLPLLQQQIWELVKQTNLDSDLQMKLLHHDHDHDDEHGHHHHHGHAHDHSHGDHDHDHPHDHSHEGELPEALSAMGGSDVAHLIEDLDGYLCELGAAQIRDGLHILGRAPDAAQMPDMLVSLTRLPNQDIPGLQEEMARLFGLKLDMLLENKGQRLNADSALARIAGRAVVTRADAIEAIDDLCVRLMQTLQDSEYRVEAINGILQSMFGDLSIDKPRLQTASLRQPGSVIGQMKMQARARPLVAAPVIAKAPEPATDKFAALRRVLDFTCRQLLPNLHRAGDEIGNLLLGLEGGYVPAGPSGSPTRGMAHILPTGRNFYSVDPRSVPSQSAWRVGQQLAREVLERHWRETGAYPESVAISIWGTSAMRTHGDDVAQILCLLGVRPVWRPGNRQVSGIEVVPLQELQRPRIDVTTRISGFFRDAFPQLIDLIDDAVNAVIALDEPLDQNFVRKHYLQELGEWIGKGLGQDEAQERAAYRIFGAKPGSYGAGILPLIQEKNWQADADFAEAYINWGGYAYARKLGDKQGSDQRDAFRTRLSGVQVALHNQDNREHDIFDSDDYLQYHGGMIATIRSLTGQQPRHYFGDSHDPARAQVRDLKQETLRVFRSRVVNPKWLDSIQRHGYKGGLELTATVDYLFGYDATAQVMDDWMYEQLAQTYAFDPGMQRFLEEANPWAQNAIAERLLEAASRGMWEEPQAQTLEDLRQLYLKSETLLEARGETPRGV
ncbi:MULTISPECIES: cobaltochelatase subunit CobN [unclassified Herbaspirillum]|uniref:cobaltochelatase subunit CobN n=1 Tax=unclassified Herbaspirillum TaxID=2624150 RepID=UPI000E2FA5BB|nr:MULTISPECIES: cobaltochelatase subunit CobN [unclassified Herbaspirillum]RFB73288.1 cobaltochelatase subunit CobN [Herbaspirillum sp. 3R-3a1]TFI10903.1 cobaltochelatase subunit CobN [Herbaspirillum sp. 3R11]TFI16811.1 cobaltochelatase subunit CobN [Herbaspirillum sp. 3R-11]TFI26093.1 cobaltochelatase subunit CobN [Herbaspirillum sp. 3C11]